VLQLAVIPLYTASFLVTLSPYALALPWIRTFGLIFPILTSVFITSISIAVTYVSFKAYSREGLPSVLFLGCGTLVFGSTSLLTSMFLGSEGLNFSGTVFAIGAMVSGVFHLACASSTQAGGAPSRGGRYLGSFWLAVAFLCVASIVIAALEGALPPFYEAGKGVTAAGNIALGVAVVAFASSFVLIFDAFSSSRSPVLGRYSMALGATALGILGIMLSNGDVQALPMRIGWAALYFGGLLLLTSVLSAEKRA
jgi:hypothetical protein